MKKTINKLGIFFICFLITVYTKASIIEGNPQGFITLVEFYDYSCPHCRAMNPILNELLRNNKNLRIVYRPVGVLDENSVRGALSVIAASKQNKFRAMNQVFMDSQSLITNVLIDQVAIKAGIDRSRLNNSMQSGEVKEEFIQNMSLAEKLDIKSFPTLIIGRSSADRPENVFYGETSLTELQATVDKLSSN